MIIDCLTIVNRLLNVYYTMVRLLKVC